MCGCGGTSLTEPSSGSGTPPSITSSENCLIDWFMLENWKGFLDCVQNNDLYAQLHINNADLNRMRGTVQSAMNWKSNYCYFEVQLQEVQQLMPMIIALNQCN